MNWIRTALGWAGLALPPSLLPAIIIGALVTGGFACFVTGYRLASGKCEAAQLRAEVAQLKRDRDAARASEMWSDSMAAALAAENEKLQDEVEAYAKDLETRPDGRCALTPDDLRRLR